MEQKEYQTFAQQVAMASPGDYAVFLPGSVQYMEVKMDSSSKNIGFMWFVLYNFSACIC